MIIPGFQLSTTVKDKLTCSMCLSFTIHREHFSSDTSGHQMYGYPAPPPPPQQFFETPAGHPRIQFNSDSLHLEIPPSYTPEIQS